ncbi:MAG: hypothetical protein WCV73_04560 [Patescibacteria group bacterium]|jgi:hypothetical protein
MRSVIIILAVAIIAATVDCANNGGFLKTPDSFALQQRLIAADSAMTPVIFTGHGTLRNKGDEWFTDEEKSKTSGMYLGVLTPSTINLRTGKPLSADYLKSLVGKPLFLSGYLRKTNPDALVQLGQKLELGAISVRESIED